MGAQYCTRFAKSHLEEQRDRRTVYLALTNVCNCTGEDGLVTGQTRVPFKWFLVNRAQYSTSWTTAGESRLKSGLFTYSTEVLIFKPNTAQTPFVEVRLCLCKRRKGQVKEKEARETRREKKNISMRGNNATMELYYFCFLLNETSKVVYVRVYIPSLYTWRFSE